MIMLTTMKANRGFQLENFLCPTQKYKWFAESITLIATLISMCSVSHDETFSTHASIKI